MKVWKNSISKVYYADKETSETGACIVRLGDGQLTVSYDYHDGDRMVAEVYDGIEIGQGHFKLKSQDGQGVASLHCFPEGRILEGWWHEVDQEGMWRIQLAD